MYKTTTASEQETEALAAQLAKKLRAGDVVAFRGGLGAGKTAFVRGLAQGLGIAADVSSPTFALAHEYRGAGALLVHFDLYRITDPDSLYATGFFDYLEGEGILAIEWSEKIGEDLPDGAIAVTITPTGENTREITIEGGDRLC